MEQELEPIFQSYGALMSALVSQFGANCQASLYDMRGRRPQLVAVTGTVMEAEIGSYLPEKLFDRLNSAARESGQPLLFTAATPDGRRLSSSLTLLRDASGETFGCLRIDFCIESLMHSINVLQNFCNFETPPAAAPAIAGNEDVIGMVDAIVSEVMNENGSLRTQDKRTYRMNVVRGLEKKNVFLVKGAIDLIAARMNVSKFTLYNYIDKVRSEMGSVDPKSSLRDSLQASGKADGR
ncbi:helix-turn-helix domain-containing protein [Mesorhizobium sp. ZMM04-5]|uniref:Helix-turn-helix domain-containing protein n=1 Tax=Mesorhizobium marinum TaxID=3228790 RepID=A0ABV3QX94_9HYPH